MADINSELLGLLQDRNRIRDEGPPEGTTFREAVAPLVSAIGKLKDTLPKDVYDATVAASLIQSKAKGGKVPGYAHGTPKGGVKKMSACKGRKAASSAEKD